MTKENYFDVVNQIDHKYNYLVYINIFIFVLCFINPSLYIVFIIVHRISIVIVLHLALRRYSQYQDVKDMLK